MTQISRYPIHKDVEKRMFELFLTAIESLNNKQDIEEFIDDFLSPVEKIMLAKRLSIAVLLNKDYKYKSISKILRVTPSTIASVSLQLKYSGKGYQKFVEKVAKNEKISAFWQKIEDILSHIPASKGSDWKYHRSKYEKSKQNKKKAF